MQKLAQLTEENIVQLPAEVAKHFRPLEKFMAWYDGDTLHLKPIARSPLDAVEQAPEGDPLSLDEIEEIVHEVRQRRNES